MEIYIVIFMVCFFFGTIELAAPKSSPKYKLAHLFFFISLSSFLFIIAAFRECGFDYYNYFVYFGELNNSEWLTTGLKIGSEPGYSLLNYLARNYETVVAVMSFAIIGTQFTFIYKHSALPFLALIFYLGLFFYPSTMGQYRQALAIGIVLWAIINVNNRIRFLSIIALAMMFHFSAILAVIVLIIPKKLLSSKFYMVAFIAAVLCSVTFQSLYLSIISSLPTYIKIKLEHYASVENASLGINTAVLIRAFVFFACNYFRAKIIKIDKMELFMNVYFLSLLIYTAFGFAPQVAGRGSIYFSFFEIILVSNLIFVLRGWKCVFFYIIFVVLSFYRQIQFFAQWADMNYIPYSNWLVNLF